MSCIFSWPTLCKTNFSDVKGLQCFFPDHVPSQIFTTNWWTKSGQACKWNDWKRTMSPWFTWIYHRNACLSLSNFLFIRPHPQEATHSFNMDSFKTNSGIWHHPKIIQNTSKTSTNLDYSATISEIQVLKCLQRFKIIKLAQLLCLQDSNWFNLTSQKHVPLTYPFLWLVKNFPTNFKPTRLHEFSGENTAHVQVLGVGFKGFVVAQDLRRACRRHWRNQ